MLRVSWPVRKAELSERFVNVKVIDPGVRAAERRRCPVWVHAADPVC